MDGDTCQEGKCSAQGTRKVDVTGKCHCSLGYAGAQCDQCREGHTGDTCAQCKPGFVMDHKEICHEGECDSLGTQEQSTNRTCVCKVNFAGLKCDHCAHSYIGSVCDQCDEHFYPVDGQCLPCSIRGTQHNFGMQKYNEDGTCKCWPGFSGAICQECAPGHHGTLCQYCFEGFYKHNKLCFGTDFSLNT